MKKLLLPMLTCLFLAACSNDHKDIRQWMAEAAQGQRGRVAPLPEVRPYEPIPYTIEGTDPFSISRLGLERPVGGSHSTIQPPLDKLPEPLEAFPLETLRYVGVMTRDNVRHGIIRADGALHQVRIGNFMGQNWGKITQITETEISLTEIVQDSFGEWSEREISLMLQEEGRR